jgi:hypothetical protein
MNNMNSQPQRKSMTKAEEDTQRMLQAGYRALVSVETPVLFKPADDELRQAGVSEADIDKYNGRGDAHHPNEDECGHDTRPKYVLLCNQEHFDRLSQVSRPFGAVLYVTSLQLGTPSF